jgi:hypothetical protein
MKSSTEARPSKSTGTGKLWPSASAEGLFIHGGERQVVDHVADRLDDDLDVIEVAPGAP